MFLNVGWFMPPLPPPPSTPPKHLQKRASNRLREGHVSECHASPGCRHHHESRQPWSSSTDCLLVDSSGGARRGRYLLPPPKHSATFGRAEKINAPFYYYLPSHPHISLYNLADNPNETPTREQRAPLSNLKISRILACPGFLPCREQILFVLLCPQSTSEQKILKGRSRSNRA